MGHLANIMVWGYANAFGVFQLYYKQTTDWPAAQISWIGSIQLFLMFIMGTVSGRLADAGLARHCIFGGSVLCVFGVFMTSVSTQYWQLILTQGVCTGIGGGLMAMPTATIIGSDFKKKRALAMSISACGTGVGAMVYTAALQYLIPQIGFQWAVRACGLISLFLATIANALARPRLPPRKSASFVDWTFFKDRPFVIFTTGSFLIYYSLFTVVIYINSYARTVVGFSDVDSAQVLLVSNAAALISRPLAGFMADRYFGPVNTWNGGTMFLSIMIFALIGVRDRAGMLVYSAVMGFCNGAAQGVFPGAISSLVEDVHLLGTRLGMVFAICGLATLAGPPTMGALLDANGGRYLWAQVWGGAVMILGSSIVATTRCFRSKGSRGKM
ncbi:putative major facilitator superfamily transporter protein [Phaeoacremonium minimum UCRPA7]|uniref:Putative major facilitator superfamily transporter protein n=1 Tax=Phaeoacremonium minimum (strain UCR-PA7) TaxID=1286976 RepID=R8BJL6_PHAM7|nr:putative major facilitator superfamily transporter protein [Phaeoacremonium minimum UCRPA7]EON99474.1 putative major facilitator superfamily transporter protein [Phaeoacremonium minimum UCRPA7]